MSSSTDVSRFCNFQRVQITSFKSICDFGSSGELDHAEQTVKNLCKMCCGQ